MYVILLVFQHNKHYQSLKDYCNPYQNYTDYQTFERELTAYQIGLNQTNLFEESIKT